MTRLAAVPKKCPPPEIGVWRSCVRRDCNDTGTIFTRHQGLKEPQAPDKTASYAKYYSEILFLHFTFASVHNSTKLKHNGTKAAHINVGTSVHTCEYKSAVYID